jgi:hypothetical protein
LKLNSRINSKGREMRKLRERLTFANVVSVIALFVALGGTGLAASQLGKNSVGTKQLKKNAVTTAKVKNEAITAAKVKNGTLTGTQINASTLGAVPTAQTAQALAPSEAWHEVGQPGQPPLLNEWTNFDPPATSTAAFYRDAGGVVHLKGILSGSNDATAAFFLPPGFRPPQIMEFATIAVKPGASIGVYANGEVRPVCLQSGCVVSLDGITFRTES